MYRARAAFGAMQEVVFGRTVADSGVEQIDRFGAARVLLIVSGTLYRATSGIKNEITKITPGISSRINGPAQIRKTLRLAL